MLSLDVLAALCAFSFASSITPGPNNLMLMASGMNFGFARTLPHLLGVSIGFTVMILMVGAGLAQIFKSFPIAVIALKAVGAMYMAYLAWHLATAVPATGDDAVARPAGKPITFLQAALFQWVNPKAMVMALTAVVTYVPPDNQLTGLIQVALVFGAINMPCVGLWSLLGMHLRRFLRNAFWMRAFNITAAVLLLASLYPMLKTQITQ
jgi:threonine/homoserine/homoserine lactone efflux protein